MNELFTILAIIILGLFGINVMKSKKIRDQKDEIRTQEKVIEKKQEEMRTIDDVQKRIAEIGNTPAPDRKDPPESGDSASRLERLNRMFKSDGDVEG